MLNENGALPAGKLDALLIEASEIMSVLGKAEKTARENLKNSSSKI